MNMKRDIQRLAWCICFFGMQALSAAAKTPATYSFSVVPQLDVAEIHKDWTPLLQHIERETGIKLILRVKASIEKFQADVVAGEPDFAYMGTYHIVFSRNAQAYVPLLRDRTVLTGVLLTRRDSHYKSVQDLDGEVIGFPSPNAFVASLYMRTLLSQSEKIRFEPRYLTNHSNVMRNVARRTVVAGASASSAYNDEVPELREQLRVLYRTPPVASHPIAAHPRVPVAVRTALTRAILALAEQDAGRMILKNIRIPEPVLANYERDYAPLEALMSRNPVVATPR